MKLFKCSKKCCQIKIYPYDIKPELMKKTKKKKRKAGVFVYDPKTDKVLLVQSRGNLWGPPKGTIKYGETERECGILHNLNLVISIIKIINNNKV